MKFIISAFALMGAASLSFGQTASPSATADKAKVSDTQAGTPARTDVYHVHFAKSALGKAAQHADSLKKQDPKAPMPGHYVMFRHQDGDAWDYCVIEHLGTKATVEAVRPPLPAGQRDLNEWHTDTYCNGPAWADFARISVYSDSINDLPLLERATDPVATNPSPTLEAVAVARGWRILRLFE